MTTKTSYLNKAEFCEATHTPLDCWLFENQGPRSIFWVTENDDPEEVTQEVFYYDDGRGTVRAFRKMEQYGEIWSRNITAKSSIWSTWAEY